jgi:mxaJ protein
MSLRYLRWGGLVFAIVSAVAAAAPPLRICADPDNLPFSNRAEQGFDNRIAILIAHTLGRTPQFIWARSRRGFLREEFERGACDVLMGAPVGMHGVASTDPYYRSTYVFVTPKREHVQIASFDDPHLKERRIGLQVLEENYAPPSLPLIREGHAAQLVGFNSFGTRNAEIVRAVADGRVGTAVVWGPIAGYFTRSQHLPLTLTPVSPSVDVSGVPFSYSLGIALHKQDAALRLALNAALRKSQTRIQGILAEYNVPTLSFGKGAQ